MLQVRVIAPGGAVVSGPARIALSPEQHGRRVAVLGAARRKGVYDLPAGAGITLKHGEEFGLERDDGRLNRALFEVVDPEAPGDSDPTGAGGPGEGGGGSEPA